MTRKVPKAPYRRPPEWCGWFLLLRPFEFSLRLSTCFGWLDLLWVVGLKGESMFESLSERIHQDELKEESNGQRFTRYALIALVAVGVIAALVQGAGLMG